MLSKLRAAIWILQAFFKFLFFALFLRLPDGAARIIDYNFFLPPYTAPPGFEPTSVELHETGTFERCSADWTIAPRLDASDFDKVFKSL